MRVPFKGPRQPEAESVRTTKALEGIPCAEG